MNKLGLTAILCLLACPSFAGTPVTLRAATEVNRPSIRLADVFDNLPEGIDRDIAVAPVYGKSVTYDARVLAKLAEQYRLDWLPQPGADHVVLSRSATRITPDMIQAAVVQKIGDILKNKKTTVEITFDNRNLELFVPPERVPDFSLVNFSYDEPSRRFRAELVAQTGGQPVSHPIAGRASLKRSLPVLARRLTAGTTIGESDLTWMSVNDEQIGADVITDAAQLVGQELRHDQPESDVLRTRDVMAPRLVTRGSLVTMKIETPLMQIMTQGKALQDGAKGDVVRVNNMQTNRIVEGTVEASGVVRIGPFPQIASAH